MTKIKLHIDTKCYKNKPNDFNLIKPRLQNNNTIQEIELNELIKKIKLGYSISPGIMINGMSANNWTEQSLFMIDIDNNNKDVPILKVHQALDICKKNNLIPLFYYYTFNHTKEKPKYRLVFLMNKPITDAKIREQIILTLINLFPQSDTSCKNADRIFLSTNKQVTIYDADARINIDNVLRLFNHHNINNNSTKDLDNPKYNFDLLEYMCINNEISHSTNDITYFKNCSICGHNDCLRYYHKSNTFYCFGANGCIGGTIIDYLMANEKLTLQQAMKKFENELNKTKSNIITNKFEWFTAEELQNMDLPEVIFFVSKIIPQGLNLICSAPKLGKSWFALQLCLSITSGKSFLGFNTKQCSCMYLALEDSKNRLYERTKKLLNGKEFPSNLYLTTSIVDINNGLIDTLEKMIQQHQDIKVIVIDTLQKIRGISKSNNVYANDYKELSLLKTFADKNNLSIILIHHLRKGIKGFESEDVFESILGTNGLMGTADTTIVLKKKNRQSEETQMYITGRDVELNDYVIKFNKDKCKWQMIGNVDNYNEHLKRQSYINNTLVTTIKSLLKDKNVWTGTLKELNIEHFKLYNNYYSDTSQKLRKELINIESLLLECDNIVYIPSSKYPTNKGRIIALKKV